MANRQLMRAGATLEDVIGALNGFYTTYLERCIRENEEFALRAENDCYRENCQENDKVAGNFHKSCFLPLIYS